MKEVLIFAGTTEGRELSECLSEARIPHTVCVATPYGEEIMRESVLAEGERPCTDVHCGRMDRSGIRAWLKERRFAAVVDATHPYAAVVTENIRAAMEGLDLPYLRLKRDTKEPEAEGNIRFFESHSACAARLAQTEGNILLTTGSKELAPYCVSERLKERLYVRVLPARESLELCAAQKIAGRQILALQGPFSRELNEAILRQYQIRWLVTKQSGRAGGYPEKLEAAQNAGVSVCVIGRPDSDTGESFEEVCRRLETLYNRTIDCRESWEITLAGIGMGGVDCMTQAVRNRIGEADILLGAERMISPYTPRLEKKPFYRPDQIIPYLEGLGRDSRGRRRRRAVVLFSGDSGFYSGCNALHRALQEEIGAGRLKASLEILPGISSVSFLAAALGESYEDAALYSIHGKTVKNLAEKIRREKKTFLLLSGAADLRRLGELLLEAGLGSCTVSVGSELSYPEQRVFSLTPGECAGWEKEGLYTCCVKNPLAQTGRLTPGWRDTDFVRDKVPMTKEEVREVSICKLRLHCGAVVWDIGSGTGSVAAEIGALSDETEVFAIERKPEAVALIRQNLKKFGRTNVRVVEAFAPEGLEGLPAPTHVFVGGSGGRLREILDACYRANAKARIVINAVSLETICGLREILESYPVEEEEIVQLQVSRTRKAGAYHLMQAENPVWICSFSFRETE
ncbi:MAG: precorrin-6A reductase [Eubacteriales bacterium]|nr:precorrin-6A reductase [Eubacteriales bacterium]